MESATKPRAASAGSEPAEPQSETARSSIARTEPRALRTYTPTLAVIARSEGCYHYTADGAKLADFTSGVLVTSLGHNPVRWWQRLLKHLGHGETPPAGEYFAAAPLSAYNAITQVEALACERLLANLRSQPGGARMQQVMWAASGSEAVIKALRTALAQDPQRQMILATRGGFHGKKGLAGAVTGGEGDPERDPRVRFIGFPLQECQPLERRNDPIKLDRYRKELEHLARKFENQICCLITEPYLGGGGSYQPQPEYLHLLEQFCRERGIVFILDEVQSNFGRTGPMYAFTRYGVEPDIVTLVKAMGNGVPVDAAVGRADLFDKLNYGEASDTWSGHPLGCAAVLATLEEFEAGDVLTRAAALSRTLEEGLTRLLETEAVTAVRGEGTVWGVQCAALDGRTSSEVARQVVRECYLGDDQGRAIHLLGPLRGDVIRVAPPLVMPPAEASEYLDAMYAIVARVAKG
jgi:4-aminobutyrate aminotransferase-like enzyme